MHGRERFVNGKDGRLLVGCYVASEEVHSKFRMLHVPPQHTQFRDAMPLSTWDE